MVEEQGASWYSLASSVFLPRGRAATCNFPLAAEETSQRERFLWRVLNNRGTPRSRNRDGRRLVRQ